MKKRACFWRRSKQHERLALSAGSKPVRQHDRSVLNEYQPDLLILCHGGNDILRKKDTARMAMNIKAMIELAKGKNIPVILLAVPEFGLFLSPAEVYNEIAESTGVYFIEDLVPDILSDNSMKSDSVHPNNKGYRVMAETIYHVLKKAEAI